MKLEHRPYTLIVLDGWGCSEDDKHNAISGASKPNWDRLWQDYTHTLIDASGLSVGLPDAQMGNSEVGHMNIGAGRVVHQDSTRIRQAIEDGSFFETPVFCKALEEAAKQNKAVHIMGLLSPGGVHSHQDHICALVKLASRYQPAGIHVHAFLDGRDTPPQSAIGYLQEVQDYMQETGQGHFASVIGRYLAMDRNNNWERTRTAYELVCDGSAEHQAPDAISAVEAAYARGETDEFVSATAIIGADNKGSRVEDGDVIIFANFRADRARQLSQAFTDPEFNGFDRKRLPKPSAFISMTQYKAEFDFPVAFPPQRLHNGLGEYLANLGLHQLRIAETEKYAHVTFFLNGGEEQVFEHEDRVLVPSPDVATYDMQPEMSAPEVTTRLIDAVNSGDYDVIICNFANADMVGHTGDYAAAVKAIETIDECLGRITDAVQQAGGELLVTADHGNAEQMRALEADDGEAQPHTAHTSNLVPLLYIGREAEAQPGIGALCDIAPTLLYIMGLEPPAEMTGRPLVHLRDHPQHAVAGK